MKTKKSLPIRMFLFFLNSAVLCAGILVILFADVSAVKKAAQDQTENNLRTFAYALSPVLSEHRDSLDKFVKDIAASNPDFRITVVNQEGKVVADSDAPDISILQNHGDREEIKSALGGSEGKTVRRSTVNNKDVMYYAVPFGEDALRLSMPVNTSVFFSENIKRTMILSGLGVLAAVVIVSIILSAHVVNQISDLQYATEQYRAGNFTYRPQIRSPRELQELGKSIGTMAEQLEKLERVRTDFVANVSHELKTPVTSIKGFSETLLDGALDDKETARHFVEIIYSQTDRLSNIIEDLLTLSRLEQDNRQPELIPADVTELCADVCESFRNAADKKNQTISFVSSAPAEVLLNTGLFSQAIANILDNAVKYCPEKTAIDCSVQKGTNGNILITIQDTGTGIAPEYRDRIFERFFRVDKGRSRETGGTGLGLSITAHIIKLHGGTVKAAERTDGKSGARFIITLPEYIGEKNIQAAR